MTSPLKLTSAQAKRLEKNLKKNEGAQEMANPNKTNVMYQETCPVCGAKIKRTYSHYMKHVERGEMTHKAVEVKTVKHVFEKVKK